MALALVLELILELVVELVAELVVELVAELVVWFEFDVVTEEIEAFEKRVFLLVFG